MTKLPKDFTGLATIEQARPGAYLKKIRGGEPTKKEYSARGYCRYNQAYEVEDLEDISADTYLKKGAKVFITCNY